MVKKLKKGFFRVNPYNPPLPLTGTWYAIENDNSFVIYNDGVPKTTYSGFSRGFGKVNSTFNTEYVIFGPTGSGLRCVDQLGRVNILKSALSSDWSFVCLNNHILLIEFDGNATITVTAYEIVGASVSPLLNQVGQATYTDPNTYNVAQVCAVKLSETEAYIFTAYPTQRSVKLIFDSSTKGISFVSEPGSITNLANPPATFEPNNTGLYFSNPMTHCAKVTYSSSAGNYTSSTIVIYNQATGTLVNTYNISVSGDRWVPATKVFLEENGNGYAFVSDSSGGVVRFRLFRLSGGTATQLASANSATVSGNHNNNTQSGFYPYYGVFAPMSGGPNGYVVYKANATVSSITVSNATNSSSASTPTIYFGNTIKWIG